MDQVDVPKKVETVREEPRHKESSDHEKDYGQSEPSSSSSSESSEQEEEVKQPAKPQPKKPM